MVRFNFRVCQMNICQKCKLVNIDTRLYMYISCMDVNVADIPNIHPHAAVTVVRV